MSGPFGSSQWMYSSGGGFYPTTIGQSLRFNDNDSAYLSRTPASTTNRKTWTYSVWAKVAKQDSYGMLLEASDGSGLNEVTIGIDGLNKIVFYSYIGAYQLQLISRQNLIRDPSAWYHFVFVADTTQATASERARIYINGVRLTSGFTHQAYPSQNYDTYMNLTQPHSIGRNRQVGRYFDGYMAECNFIDGQALDPTDFGKFKSGVWVAKSYAGSYGTNGWYLDFANSGSIGADSSGNGNNWTANNLAATDQVLDSPTQNWATLNPLDRFGSGQSLANGNLQYARSGGGWASNRGTVSVSSGKWYFEAVALEALTYLDVGVAKSDYSLASNYFGADASSWVIQGNGDKVHNNSFTNLTSAYSTGDIIMVAFDVDDGKIWFGKNGTWLASGVPSTGTNAAFTNLSAPLVPAFSAYNEASGIVANFGQDSSFAGNKTAQGNTDANGRGDFYYTPPSGYLALCTANLPIVEAVDPNEENSPQDYFNAVLYTGNGSTQSITSVDWKPDFVWIKRRNSTNQHNLHDIVRGPTKVLHSNSTEGEETITNGLTSFNATGFSLGSDGAWNASGQPYVAWNWKGSNTTASNTSGSITSTVSVNQDAGFSVLTYTGNGTTGATVGHGLGKAPDFYWVRWRNNTSNYHVYHSSLGATKGLILNETNSAATNAGFWNNTAPTSSVFSLGYYGGSNANGGLFSAVCFTEIDGFSKFGSYTGNGSSDGTFVYTGFRPAYILFKRTDISGDIWGILDSSRNTYNVVNSRLEAHNSSSEQSDYNIMDFLSNGFKLRDTDRSWNGSGGTFVYAAFAESPFKYALAR